MTNLGQSSSTDDFYAVPVEIQTDPIDHRDAWENKISILNLYIFPQKRHLLDVIHTNVQTEYNADFGPLYDFTESTSTQTDLLQFK